MKSLFDNGVNYRLINKLSGRSCTATVQTWDPRTVKIIQMSPGTGADRFRIIGLDDGKYEIMQDFVPDSPDKGKCFTSEGESKPIELESWKLYNNPSQRWYIQPVAGTPYYVIKLSGTEKVLTIKDKSEQGDVVLLEKPTVNVPKECQMWEIQLIN